MAALPEPSPRVCCGTNYKQGLGTRNLLIGEEENFLGTYVAKAWRHEMSVEHAENCVLIEESYVTRGTTEDGGGVFA